MLSFGWFPGVWNSDAGESPKRKHTTVANISKKCTAIEMLVTIYQLTLCNNPQDLIFATTGVRMSNLTQQQFTMLQVTWSMGQGVVTVVTTKLVYLSMMVNVASFFHTTGTYDTTATLTCLMTKLTKLLSNTEKPLDIFSIRWVACILGLWPVIVHSSGQRL